MAKSKNELLDEADALGVTGVDEDTSNADIEAAIARAKENQEAQSALGPPAPLGGDEGETFKPQKNPNVGIQPLTDDDLPDALR